jgi:hypothetical protein
LLKTLDANMSSGAIQLGTLCLVVLNPVLIVAGCAIPEDKQFQTALMLLAAALLLGTGTMSPQRALVTGLTLSLSVLFKLFGIFLLPLWLVRARKEWRFAAWSTLGGIVPIGLSFAAFGHHFVATMLSRGVHNSIDGAEHASPWTLLAGFAGPEYVLVKTAVVVAFCGVFVMLLTRRRIDLLNLCAALAVAFACLWLDKGAMNRMNIAILFAMASTCTLSSGLFLAFAAGNAIVTTVGYAVGVGLLRLHPEAVDAVLVSIFVLVYPIALLFFTHLRSAAGSSPTEARGVSQA